MYKALAILVPMLFGLRLRFPAKGQTCGNGKSNVVSSGEQKLIAAQQKAWPRKTLEQNCCQHALFQAQYAEPYFARPQLAARVAVSTHLTQHGWAGPEFEYGRKGTCVQASQALESVRRFPNR